MDIDLPGEDGIAGTRRLKALHPDVAVVMLTVHDDADRLVEAVKAGAQATWSRTSDPRTCSRNCAVWRAARRRSPDAWRRGCWKSSASITRSRLSPTQA
jgi:DNA-binding NarL/FixJ family response regulator